MRRRLDGDDRRSSRSEDVPRTAFRVAVGKAASRYGRPVNGRPRDETKLDLAMGRPTLSLEADDLARRVMSLLTASENDGFGGRLDARIRGSAESAEWFKNPHVYLAELDPDCVAGIIDWLSKEYERLRERAVSRGWEVPD
jgi:hypothetical protein